MRRLWAVGALAAVLLAGGCGGGGHSSSSSGSSSAGSSSSVGGSASSASGSVGGSSSTPGAANSATTVPRPPGVPPGNTLVGSLRLVSPAFKPGGAIPRTYTCDGSDTSLPLRIAGVPRGTVELVLVMRDPDAPGGNFVHWAVAGISPSTTGFAAGGVPGLVSPGRNSFGTLGYRGPCPPAGDKPHHYVLTLIALSGRSGLRAGFNPDQLRTGALAIATLIGTYRRG